MTKKICYVTGCLGFIGFYVAKTLLDKGWYVRGVDKVTYAANPEALYKLSEYQNFLFEHRDINDIEFIYDCDYVINTAAETHVGNSIVTSSEFVKSNINGVQNLLEVIRNYRQENKYVPRLIHFSTDEVYGDIDQGAHVETDILKPSNPYSATKAAADMLIQAWSRTYGIEYTILRPTNNYGIGQYVEKLIPKTCKYFMLNKKMPLHNNGTPIRNWLHAQDTSDAVVAVIENHEKTTNQIYNISGNFEQSNIETVKQIFDICSKTESYENYVDLSVTRKGQDVRYCLNDDKLRNLGWSNKKNFEEELPAIVEYYTKTFIW